MLFLRNLFLHSYLKSSAGTNYGPNTSGEASGSYSQVRNFFGGHCTGFEKKKNTRSPSTSGPFLGQKLGNTRVLHLLVLLNHIETSPYGSLTGISTLGHVQYSTACYTTKKPQKLDFLDQKGLNFHKNHYFLDIFHQIFRCCDVPNACRCLYCTVIAARQRGKPFPHG